ncbi:MAG TPA: hypothetical protein PKA61_15135, partial [Nitrospira sp.]|nr:hypothetical protein [Nitrospira sp.]
MMRPLTRGIWSGAVGLALLFSATIGSSGPVDPQAEPPRFASSELQELPGNGPPPEAVEATSALRQTTEIPQKAK